MPTVLRDGGFTVMTYNPPREHGPAHVHVFRADGQTVIDLDPVRVARVARIRPADVVAVVRLAEECRDMLLAEWRRIHG